MAEIGLSADAVAALDRLAVDEWREWEEQLRECLALLTGALDDAGRLTAVLQRLQRQLDRLARVAKRRQKPSHAQLLNDPDVLEWAA